MYITFPAIKDEFGWSRHRTIEAAVRKADRVASFLPRGEFAEVYHAGVRVYRAGGFAPTPITESENRLMDGNR